MRSDPQKQLLTAFVVDDEQGPLEVLAADLRQMPEIGEVYTFSSYSEATLPLIELQPNVVFLDVEVPGKSGLDFLESIRQRLSFSFHAVFYTGYSHYMLEAIRMSVFDFLLKPYKVEELRTIIERLTHEQSSRHCAPGHGYYSYDTSPRKLALQTVSELLLLRVEEILMAQYDRDARAWQLTLTDKSTHRLPTSTSAAALLALSTDFVRINSGCIVNLAYLVAVENNTQRCRLCSPYEDTVLTASRRYFGKLKERFELC